MTTAIFLAMFSMGFLGSPHCLGMCGGIVTAFGLSMQQLSPRKKNMLIISYHFGRLLSYSFLGLVAGLIGTTILAPFMQSELPRVLLGIILVLIGFAILGMPFFNHLEKLGLKLWQAMSPIRQKVFPLDSIPKALFAGLLWGFLPCGLVYGALMMAVASGSVATGALLMFVFGLGTLPMLVATQKTISILQQRIKQFRLRQINGGALVLSGLAIVFIPMAMHALHGEHHHHHMAVNHHQGHAHHSHSHHEHHQPIHENGKHEHGHSHHVTPNHATASSPSHTHQH